MKEKEDRMIKNWAEGGKGEGGMQWMHFIGCSCPFPFHMRFKDYKIGETNLFTKSKGLHSKLTVAGVTFCWDVIEGRATCRRCLMVLFMSFYRSACRRCCLVLFMSSEVRISLLSSGSFHELRGPHVVVVFWFFSWAPRSACCCCLLVLFIISEVRISSLSLVLFMSSEVHKSLLSFGSLHELRGLHIVIVSGSFHELQGLHVVVVFWFFSWASRAACRRCLLVLFMISEVRISSLYLVLFMSSEVRMSSVVSGSFRAPMHFRSVNF